MTLCFKCTREKLVTLVAYLPTFLQTVAEIVASTLYITKIIFFSCVEKHRKTWIWYYTCTRCLHLESSPCLSCLSVLKYFLRVSLKLRELFTNTRFLESSNYGNRTMTHSVINSSLPTFLCSLVMRGSLRWFWETSFTASSTSLIALAMWRMMRRNFDLSLISSGMWLSFCFRAGNDQTHKLHWLHAINSVLVAGHITINKS